MHINTGSVEIEITRSWVHIEVGKRGLFWCWVRCNREFVTN